MKIDAMQFGSKARTLIALEGRVASARVLPAQVFTLTQWRADPDTILGQIRDTFAGQRLAVRSSAAGEDSTAASMAGKYLTVLNVEAGATETGAAENGDARAGGSLRDAVERVIASYPADGRDHDVLIQPMLNGARLSGVAFNRDPQSGSAYRVVNYAYGSDTTAVTGGAAETLTFVAAPGASAPDGDLTRVLALLDELENLFAGAPLDVEFAIDVDALYVLQVRPLIVQATAALASSADFAAQLDRIAAKIEAAQTPHPFLCGRSTVFGVMPDWNPAEIIGVRPRPLALSLYRDLVTDGIWAYQRDNYGYRNLRSFPLVVHFAGQPYVDVRVSFNSFIPKSVVPELADRLVDHYIDRLTAAPALHDKVEFEIVMSCATFDLPARLKDLAAHGFSADDCEHLTLSLRDLTNRIVNAKSGLWRVDRAKIDILAARRPQIENSALDPLARIYWLLEDCKRYGTLPFAGLARAGFIAMQMLRSLVAVGVLSDQDHDAFLTGVETVSGQFVRDLADLSREDFLKHYGHLRPGTYDLMSPRYDEAPDLYLGTATPSKVRSPRQAFIPTTAQQKDIASHLGALGLDMSVDDLFAFLRAGIELRELAKFEFTRNLS
ncbi:MAG: hypothetical protein KDE14_08655, partial [Rhodobacteraceae bacterium]|nr:hypothetical protein [Paracoccaceae bacterium]